MTCKDCIHEEICDMPIITDGRKNASNCKKFKNKADFVEVVRCSECKHFAYGTCTNDFAMNLSRADDYCSYGERMGAE